MTTNGSGDVNFNTLLSGVVLAGRDRVTATATVDLGGGNFGNSSEFGQNVQAQANWYIGTSGVDTTTASGNADLITSSANLASDGQFLNGSATLGDFSSYGSGQSFGS